MSSARGRRPPSVRQRPLQGAQRLWRTIRLPLLVLLFVLSLVLGYVGFSNYAEATGEPLSPSDVLYLTLQLAALESGAVSGPIGWELEAARWLMPAVAAYTAVLTVATIFRQQFKLLALRFTRGHVVICGLGEKGRLLTRAFLRRGHTVVIIERDAAHPQLTLCRQEGATAIVGDATKSQVLRKAAVGSARYLIAVCGDDGANVAIALAARDLARGRRRGALTGAVHIASPTLTEMLRETELSAEPVPAFRLEIFSVADRAARELLREHSPLGPAAPTFEEAPSILVVGLGAVGRSLIAQAAERWYQEPDRGSDRLRVTAVDVAASKTIDALRGRYPRLDECCDLVGWETEPESLAAPGGPGLDDWQARIPFDTITVCLDDPSLALQVALALRRLPGAEDAPIVVLMPEGDGLVRLLHEYRGTAFSLRNIHPFDPLARTCTPHLVLDGTHELLARAVHENYLRKRLEEGQHMGDERALVAWDDLPEDLKESNRRQVDHIRAKLSAAGYTIAPLVDWEAASFRFSPDEVERMARLEHDRWVAERKHNEWRHAPGPKDPDRKTHPDMVPWEDLSEQAKDKDREAVIELPALLARGGFQLRPEPAERQQTADG